MTQFWGLIMHQKHHVAGFPGPSGTTYNGMPHNATVHNHVKVKHTKKQNFNTVHIHATQLKQKHYLKLLH